MAVKSLHTRAAAELLRDRLAPDGYVLTVQNGLTADTLIEAVGRDRVISSFVNFGADVMAPGRIMQGNIGTFRVGELDGGRITPRVLELAEALPYASRRTTCSASCGARRPTARCCGPAPCPI